jgi:hypothetical protein
MSDWILVPCLVQLRTEFNTIAPTRDKASDGSVGDADHADSTSDHNPDETGHVPIEDADSLNEVHAIDVDKDLKVSGLSMEECVQHILARCRAGTEKLLRYIIFNGRIWEASNGWKQRTYTGSNPHDKHAHFSASYETSLEANKASWHLSDLIEEEDVPLSTDEIKKIGNEVWHRDISPDAGSNAAWTTAWTTHEDAGAAKAAAESADEKATALKTQVAGLEAQVEAQAQSIAELEAQLTTLDTGVNAKLDAILAKLETEVPPPVGG